MNREDFDTRVRRHVYDITMREGAPPPAPRVAEELSVSVSAIFESLRRLADARIFVLQPDSGEILMAPPFSAVPTPFHVNVGGVRSYANCVWDAFGVAAMLRSDADIDTSCADCGTSATLRVRERAVVDHGFMHFAVPARSWWKDIVFT